MELSRKPYTAGTVITMKMINGEEMAGTVVEETATEFIMEKLVLITMSSQGLGMMNSSFTGGGPTIMISKQHVLFAVPSNEQFVTDYKTAMSGIVTKAPPGLIV